MYEYVRTKGQIFFINSIKIIDRNMNNWALFDDSTDWSVIEIGK